MDLNPNANWNYALDVEKEKPAVELINQSGYPWDEGNSPVKIKVPARKVSNWELNKIYDEKWKLNVERTPAFPKEINSNNPVEYLELVPYGSTLLRLTVFPKIK